MCFEQESSTLYCLSEDGLELQRITIEYGAILLVENGAKS